MMWPELAILGILKAEGRPRTYAFISRRIGWSRYVYGILWAFQSLEEKGFISTYHRSDGLYRGGGQQRVARLVEE